MLLVHFFPEKTIVLDLCPKELTNCSVIVKKRLSPAIADFVQEALYSPKRIS